MQSCSGTGGFSVKRDPTSSDQKTVAGIDRRGCFGFLNHGTIRESLIEDMVNPLTPEWVTQGLSLFSVREGGLCSGDDASMT